jgi:hypothetical protein
VIVFFRKVIISPFQWAIPWDLRYYHLPLIDYVAYSFRQGRLPLWDPYTYCGMPFYAIVTAQVFYPPTVAAVLAANRFGVDLLYALELQTFAHVLLGGLFAYQLLRRLGTGAMAALAGATLFQIGPFFASQIQHLGAIDAAAWMPLAFRAVVELADRFTWRWLAWLGIALALAMLAGFPAVTAVVAAACGFLAAALVVIRRRSPAVLAALAIAALLAAVLSAVQLLPTAELIRHSVARFRADWLGDGGGLPLQSLVSFLHPNYYGQFQFDANTWKLPWNITFLHLYCGVAGLACIAAALAWWKDRRARVFGLLTLIALLWALGEHTPAGLWIFRILPYSIKAPFYAEYALSMLALCLAVMAGLGAQRLTRSKPPWTGALLVLAVAADLTLVASGRPMNTSDRGDEPALGFNHIDHYPIPPVVRQLVEQQTPPWRIDTMNGSMNWCAAPLFHVPMAGGNDPLALERLMKVRRCFTGGERWGRYYQVRDPDSPLLSFLNVKYLISNGELKLGPSWRYAAELPGQRVYENARALPRFFVVSRVIGASGMEDALRRIRDPKFDPRLEAVAEGVPASAGATGSVRVAGYSPLEVKLEVEAAGPAYLVTSETHYPGWKAWIDGRETPLYYTNVAFRGLPLPEGRHTVSMRFQPRIFYAGAALSAGGWLLLCALSLKNWISRRRLKRKSTSSP